MPEIGYSDVRPQKRRPGAHARPLTGDPELVRQNFFFFFSLYPPYNPPLLLTSLKVLEIYLRISGERARTPF